MNTTWSGVWNLRKVAMYMLSFICVDNKEIKLQIIHCPYMLSWLDDSESQVFVWTISFDQKRCRYGMHKPYDIIDLK